MTESLLERYFVFVLDIYRIKYIMINNNTNCSEILMSCEVTSGSDLRGVWGGVALPQCKGESGGAEAPQCLVQDTEGITQGLRIWARIELHIDIYIVV